MDKNFPKIIVLGLLLALVGLPAYLDAGNPSRPALAGPHDTVVQLGVLATVGSDSVMLDELMKDPSPAMLGARSKVLQARYELYNVERNELSGKIDDELLKQQARKENMSVDALLDKHVKSQVKDPSEEALRIYYLGTNDTEPYAAIHDKLRTYVRQLEETKVRSDYIASLRTGRTIRVMLEPPEVAGSLQTINSIGPQLAPVTMIEFADYQCPYCRRAEPNLRRLREAFKDKLRYGYKDYPLPMHEYAQKAAEAARCAGAQGQFWAMHDRLFEGEPSSLSVTAFKAAARDLKLDGGRFDKCLDSGEMAMAIAKDKEDGRQIGLAGTPSFVINGYFLSGAAPYDVLHQFIEQQLQLSTSGQTTLSLNQTPMKTTD